ncbi:MAG: hypothetical protein LBQ33_07000 [Oscillospiraceae bacterium]|jgi:hypothetical protein|nr:hypothetical protein [Oscillospiraceae bacterium]
MVIRLTKATRFFILCLLALTGVLVSIGTRSITVASPYAASGAALPLLIYRTVESSAEAPLSLDDLRGDLRRFERSGFVALSQAALLAVLRQEKTMPTRPLLLVFDETMPGFGAQVRPLLEQEGLAWFPLARLEALQRQLRSAGYAVTRLERNSGVTMEDITI